MGLKPTPKHTLDRYPNRSGNYEPGNVRWATRKEQSTNRDATIVIAFGGETRTIEEWAVLLGMKPGTLACRIRRGWAIERALNSPVQGKNQ
jgi:hypothetical protein